MQPTSNIAFKEWAVVVDALGRGEQILILRKGGIREQRGEFHVDHPEFWLFPTQYHVAEQGIIPSKRPALCEIASTALKDAVKIQFYAIVDTAVKLVELDALKRLQGQHIWSEAVLQERFRFGREVGLHALLVRVYRLPALRRLPLLDTYGGCKSWVELEQSIPTAALEPVLGEDEFQSQRDEICGLISGYALTHP